MPLPGVMQACRKDTITVLPRTRKEDARFKRSLLDHAPDWQLIWERPALRRSSDPPERFEAVEDPEPSAEGYRIVWYRSSEKWRRDERARENAIHEARWALRRLAERVGRHKLKTREQVQQAVDKILEDSAARPWVRVELLPRERHTYKQGAPGRPGKNNFEVQLVCRDMGFTHMEGLANLDKVVGKGRFRFIGFPLKIRGGTGRPIRPVAVLDS